MSIFTAYLNRMTNVLCHFYLRIQGCVDVPAGVVQGLLWFIGRPVGNPSRSSTRSSGRDFDPFFWHWRSLYPHDLGSPSFFRKTTPSGWGHSAAGSPEISYPSTPKVDEKRKTFLFRVEIRESGAYDGIYAIYRSVCWVMSFIYLFIFCSVIRFCIFLFHELNFPAKS